MATPTPTLAQGRPTIAPRTPKIHDWPERRYEVFLSSTYDDLKEIRKRLMDVTVACGHLTSGMEYFASGTKDTELIEERISRADIFVILVGARYGSTVQKQDQHFIEMEYDLATRLEKPILAYLLDDEEYKEARAKLADGDKERSYDTALKQFRDNVKHFADGAGRIVREFSLRAGREEFLANYERDLLNVVDRQRGRGGWIRGEHFDEIENRVSLQAAVGLNPFFQRFVNEFNKFDTLTGRIMEQLPALKKLIGAYFLERYLGRMIEAGATHFFFESGSSIAFVSERFMQLLHEEQWLGEKSPDLVLQTNNILTYIDFTLSEAIRIELYPYGRPERKYGATFGKLTSLPKLEPPIRPWPLSDRAEKAVDGISQWFVENYRQRGVILMTASGVELNDQNFRGPHVGSYYNMLFKRALLRSSCSAVLFLDQHKLLNSPFVAGKCFPVCGAEKSWDAVCGENPLAIAVGCGSEASATEAQPILEGLGFVHVERRADKNGCALIASNEAFRSRWALSC